MADEHVCAERRCECRVVPPGRYESFHPRTCRNRAAGQLPDGRWACVVHLAQQARREARTRAQDARSTAQQAFEAEVAALRARYGLTSRNAGDLVLRRVHIGLDKLRALLERGASTAAREE
jgi:hypothetical protein